MRTVPVGAASQMPGTRPLPRRTAGPRCPALPTVVAPPTGPDMRSGQTTSDTSPPRSNTRCTCELHPAPAARECMTTSSTPVRTAPKACVAVRHERLRRRQLRGHPIVTVDVPGPHLDYPPNVHASSSLLAFAVLVPRAGRRLTGTSDGRALLTGRCRTGYQQRLRRIPTVPRRQRERNSLRTRSRPTSLPLHAQHPEPCRHPSLRLYDLDLCRQLPPRSAPPQTPLRLAPPPATPDQSPHATTRPHPLTRLNRPTNVRQSKKRDNQATPIEPANTPP